MKDNEGGWLAAAETRQKFTYDADVDNRKMVNAAHRTARDGADAIARSHNVDAAVGCGRVALLLGVSATNVAGLLAEWAAAHPAQVRLLQKGAV